MSKQWQSGLFFGIALSPFDFAKGEIKGLRSRLSTTLLASREHRSKQQIFYYLHLIFMEMPRL